MKNKLIEMPKTEIIKPTIAQFQPFSERIVTQLTELGILPKYTLRNSEHAIRNLDSNCLYITSCIKPFDSNISNNDRKKYKTFNVNVDISTPGIYKELLRHINLNCFTLDANKIFTPLYTVIDISSNESNIIEILLNDTSTLCYYFPEKNSFVFGNITWHDHYISIILKHVWPQIIQGLKNLGYDINPT